MGTNFISYEDCEKFNLNVLFKEYWGGEDDGVMYQISEKNAPFHYVNISRRDMLYMCVSFVKHLGDK